MNKLRKLFSKENDRVVREILDENIAKNYEAAAQARSLNELLKKNGVTLQIVISTGGDRRYGHK